MHAESMLAIQSLEVSYGAVRVLRGISFAVEAGQIVALLGANGAGKTTTLRAATGSIRPWRGRVLFEGEEVTRLSAHAKARRGLVLVPEGRQLFSDMSVEENLEMGAFSPRARTGYRQSLERVLALFPRLAERRGQKAGTLSGGEQQMLAIGRALMSSPRLLLLDEPSMGLAPLMVQRIFETIRKVAAEGVTVLLVEQNAKLALEASTRGYVMESGLITLTDSAPVLLSNPQVRQAYLGE